MSSHESPLLALLVEDEAILALEMDEMLNDAGFDTIVVSNETNARAQIARDRAVAVAVVNLSLEGELAGQRIIRFLRSHRPNLPVVVVTGYACIAEQADLRGLGGPTMRLHKPEHADQLVAAVRAVLDPAYLHQQLAKRQRR